MLEHAVRFALQNRAAVIFLTLAVAAWGVLSFRDLTVEAFPDPTDTQVNVITLFPGQPSEEVERQIGLPLERALNGTPGMSRLRNLSLFGLSYVTLTFHDGVDALFARAQVLERLRDAELPEGVSPDLGPLATPIGEIYRYTLSGGRDDPMKLRTLQDWVVRPSLMRVMGVADVVSYGGLLREVHVQPDPARLAKFGLTLADLEQAITSSSVNASGGILERGAEQFVIRSEGLYKRLEQVEGRVFAPMSNTVVAALAGALVFSVTLVPALASLVYRKGVQHRESPVLRLADRAYAPALVWALRRPWAVPRGSASPRVVLGRVRPSRDATS